MICTTLFEEICSKRRDAAQQDGRKCHDTQADHFAGWMRSQDAGSVSLEQYAIRDKYVSTQGGRDKAFTQLEQG